MGLANLHISFLRDALLNAAYTLTKYLSNSAFYSCELSTANKSKVANLRPQGLEVMFMLHHNLMKS